MISLNALLRQHVTPVLKGEGLAKKGKAYRLRADNGDHAVLEIRRHPMACAMEVFFVRVAIVPTPEWAWNYRGCWEQEKTRLPTSAAEMVGWEVIPPAQVAYEPTEDGPSRGLWAYGQHIDPASCGRALTELLIKNTIPQMYRLLDREVLLEEIKEPTLDIRRTRPLGWAEVLLNVDRVSSAELEPLLTRVERDYPVADEFIAWARQQVAERVTRG
ncbi:hypothetical protein ACFYYN_33595 [Streptomyces sp. NPDC001902]